MTELFPKRVVLVWSVLVIATAATWWLGTDHGTDNLSVRTTLVLVIAGIKMRLIAFHFMGLREAPQALRSGFDAWCGFVIAGAVLLYLVL